MKLVSLDNLTFTDREGYEKSVVLNNDDFGINAKLQIVRLAPGGHIKPHFHNIRTEVVQLLSGQGQIKVNGEVQSADFILVQPGDIHELINPGNEPMIIGVFRVNDPGDDDMLWVAETDSNE